MKSSSILSLVRSLAGGLTLAAGISATTAQAYESGYTGYAALPGITIGGTTASIPGAGLYMFDQAAAYSSNIVGPGAPKLGGAPTNLHLSGGAVGLLWVPGWEFLGAKYDAVVVQIGAMADFSPPISVTKEGLKNTYIVPIELGWKLGDSGFFVKTGLGIFAPDGTTTGANGLGSLGAPWWTLQPEIIVSYLKDGWNFTAIAFEEFNSRNSITDYQTGDILHAEFAATKSIGKWTLGPVAYYVGQVTDDSSSAFYHQAVNLNRFDVWAVGGLVGYDFGTVNLKVWGFKEVSANVSGGRPQIAGHDPATISQGFKVFAALSFRLWAPDEQTSTGKNLVPFHK